MESLLLKGGETMEGMIDIFKSILGPGTIIFAIICLINWFKMFPGAQADKYKPLWPGLAAILGAILLLLYSWVIFGITDLKSVTIVVVVGIFIGFASAGLYKLADKINK